MRNSLFVFILLFFVSCNTSPLKTNENHLVIIESNRPDHLFPANINRSEQSHVITQIHDGLLALGSNMENLQPLIAKRWFVNSNNDKFTFILYDSIFFHNDQCFTNGLGRKVTAYDVKDALEYALWYKNVQKNSLGLLQNIRGAVNFLASCDSTRHVWESSLEGIVVVDSLQLEIHLTEANPNFLFSLISADMVVLPREGVEMYGNECMVGCGPFVMEYYGTNNDSIVLSKNMKYYRFDQAGSRLPCLNFVTFMYEARPYLSLKAMRDEKAHVLLHIQKQYLSEFMDENIELFEEQNPKLILEQSKGMENTDVFMIRNVDVKNLLYSSMNLLYLDKVSIDSYNHKKDMVK